MWTFAAVLVICSTVIFVLERVVRLPLLRPKTLTPPPPQIASIIPTPPPFEIQPMPSDLIEVAERESELWAKESTLKNMFEAYETTRDWDVVRRLYTPGSGPVS